MDRSPTASIWHQPHERGIVTLVRNVSTRYALIIVYVVTGLVMLPFNVHHLGSATYGLWMLVASVTSYFSVLELGYGGAVVKFVAEARAKRDARSLNETLSTMCYVFSAIGIACYVIALIVAVLLPHIFNLEPGQVQTGRIVLLIVALQVALYFRFSIYGALINGFEQYYVNNVVGMLFNVAAALVNVLVLSLGYGLVELVAATTVMRIAPLWFYRRNAYKAFPELRIRFEYFRRDRLRELTGFSIYLAVADWSSRLTHATDSFYLGIFMNTAAVGVYAVAQRMSEALLNLTYQLHTFLMPAVVRQAIHGEPDRQQSLMVRATRFQLAVAMCLCGAVAAVADTLIRTWVGPGWESSVPVTQLLAAAVVLRVWMAMPITVLQGIGHARYVAIAACSCAVANLLLSIPLVKIWGLVGVALGTVIPVTICAAGFIFPKACRIVGLSIWQGYRGIVWPTIWPALVVMSLLSMTRHALPIGFVPVLTNLALGGVLYAVLFCLFGLDRDERRWVVSALSRIAGRRPPRLAADIVG